VGTGLRIGSQLITDEDWWVAFAVDCGMYPQEARRMAREYPKLVDAWNDVRRE